MDNDLKYDSIIRELDQIQDMVKQANAKIDTLSEHIAFTKGRTAAMSFVMGIIGGIVSYFAGKL